MLGYFVPKSLTEYNNEVKRNMASDYTIKNISLAEFGRKKLDIVETEMLELIALRKGYGAASPR